MQVKSSEITMVTVFSEYLDEHNVRSFLNCFFLMSLQNISFNVNISKYLQSDPILTSLTCTNI